MLERVGRFPFADNDDRFCGQLDPDALQQLGIDSGRETHFVREPGGRRLAVELNGKADGHTVFLFHGSPGGRTGPRLQLGQLHSLNINLVTYDRPGYGYSTPQSGRRPVDVVGDVQTIVDYLGVPPGFSVAGRSGGGPGALACAALLPGVKNAAVLSSPAPYDGMGQAWYDGVGQTNLRTLDAFERGQENLSDFVTLMHRRPAALLESVASVLAPDDRRVLASDYLRAELIRSQANAVQFGPEGWVDDTIEKYDWGFEPRTITVPTLVWYGGQDPFVPPGHGQYLVDAIPSAVPAFEPEASHFRASLAVPAALGWCATGQYHS